MHMVCHPFVKYYHFVHHFNTIITTARHATNVNYARAHYACTPSSLRVNFLCNLKTARTWWIKISLHGCNGIWSALTLIALHVHATMADACRFTRPDRRWLRRLREWNYDMLVFSRIAYIRVYSERRITIVFEVTGLTGLVGYRARDTWKNHGCWKPHWNFGARA